jgi:hypothetical protein
LVGGSPVVDTATPVTGDDWIGGRRDADWGSHEYLVVLATIDLDARLPIATARHSDGAAEPDVAAAARDGSKAYPAVEARLAVRIARDTRRVDVTHGVSQSDSLRGSRLRDVRLAHIIARPVVESKIDTGGTLAWGNADVEKGIAMVAAESAHAQMERL